MNEAGWKLSPLYDVNPSCDNKNVLSTYITETDNSQSLDLALEVCEYFEISIENAKTIISDMKNKIKNWKTVAKQFGLSKSEIDKMEVAFKI